MVKPHILGYAITQPTLKPNARPARNDALCWKSAVKKSMNQFHNEYTFGAFLLPVTGSLV